MKKFVKYFTDNCTETESLSRPTKMTLRSMSNQLNSMVNNSMVNFFRVNSKNVKI